MKKSKANQLVEEWRASLPGDTRKMFEGFARDAIAGPPTPSGLCPSVDAEPFDIEALYEAAAMLDAIVEKPWRKLFASQGVDFDTYTFVIPEKYRGALDVPRKLLGTRVRFCESYISEKPFFVVTALSVVRETPLFVGNPFCKPYSGA